MLRIAPNSATLPSMQPKKRGGVALRETILLPLDDLLAVTRESSIPRSRARVLTAVCAATGFLTSRRCETGGGGTAPSRR